MAAVTGGPAWAEGRGAGKALAPAARVAAAHSGPVGCRLLQRLRRWVHSVSGRVLPAWRHPRVRRRAHLGAKPRLLLLLLLKLLRVRQRRRRGWRRCPLRLLLLVRQRRPRLSLLLTFLLLLLMLVVVLLLRSMLPGLLG